jgi:hypothetical protein
LTEWKKNDKVTQLACKHLYCEKDACLEQIVSLGNSKCALCRAAVKINLPYATQQGRKHAQLEERCRQHLLNPKSSPMPRVTDADYIDAKQLIFLFGTAEQKASLAAHEERMAEKYRQEEISKKVLLVFLTVLGIGSLVYFTQVD